MTWDYIQTICHNIMIFKKAYKEKETKITPTGVGYLKRNNTLKLI